jgi:hypothetical protein
MNVPLQQLPIKLKDSCLCLVKFAWLARKFYMSDGSSCVGSFDYSNAKGLLTFHAQRLTKMHEALEQIGLKMDISMETRKEENTTLDYPTLKLQRVSTILSAEERDELKKLADVEDNKPSKEFCTI